METELQKIENQIAELDFEVEASFIKDTQDISKFYKQIIEDIKQFSSKNIPRALFIGLIGLQARKKYAKNRMLNDYIKIIDIPRATFFKYINVALNLGLTEDSNKTDYQNKLEELKDEIKYLSLSDLSNVKKENKTNSLEKISKFMMSLSKNLNKIFTNDYVRKLDDSSKIVLKEELEPVVRLYQSL